jgi:predicted dehydrogenase
VDGVLVATPDHWHPQITTDACASGKDVYLEKPACNGNTIESAVRMMDAVRKSNRVVQIGTQQRSWPHFAEARELLPQLGGITHVVLQYGGPGSPTTDPVAPVPPGFNWDLFQGPATHKPYKTSRQRSWRTYWDYGGGVLTDWGVHLADTALWFLQAQRKAPQLTTAVAQYASVQNPDLDRPQNVFHVVWQYDTFVMSFGNMVMGNPDFPFHGTVFYGPGGSLVVNRTGYMLRPPEARLGGRGRGAPGAPQVGSTPAIPVAPPPPPVDGKIVKGGPELEMVATATTLHVKDFLACMRTRKAPVSDVEIGFYATLPCVLGARAIRERRSFGWDAQAMRPKVL